jgi:hypothetical protein
MASKRHSFCRKLHYGDGRGKNSSVFLVPQICLALPIKKKKRGKCDTSSLSYLRKQLFSLPAHEQPSLYVMFSVTSKLERMD